ncbi:MAG: hypothetical protein NTU94_07885, partial [Planctomycetota bacterium]|nr:hypothetical protein [Planctomycetota bacterium]
GAASPYKAWVARFAEFTKTRPAQEGPELAAWRAKRIELRAEGEALRKQEQTPPPADPPSASEGRKRRHE